MSCRLDIENDHIVCIGAAGKGRLASLLSDEPLMSACKHQIVLQESHQVSHALERETNIVQACRTLLKDKPVIMEGAVVEKQVIMEGKKAYMTPFGEDGAHMMCYDNEMSDPGMSCMLMKESQHVNMGFTASSRRQFSDADVTNTSFSMIPSGKVNEDKLMVYTTEVQTKSNEMASVLKSQFQAFTRELQALTDDSPISNQVQINRR